MSPTYARSVPTSLRALFHERTHRAIVKTCGGRSSGRLPARRLRRPSGKPAVDKVAPARTGATSRGTSTARQQSGANWMSSNLMATLAGPRAGQALVSLAADQTQLPSVSGSAGRRAPSLPNIRVFPLAGAIAAWSTDQPIRGGARRCAGAVWYPPRLVGAARSRSRQRSASQQSKTESGACGGTGAGECARMSSGQCARQSEVGNTLLSENQVMAQMRSSSRVSTIIP
jgi:hypothetical protein